MSRNQRIGLLVAAVVVVVVAIGIAVVSGGDDDNDSDTAAQTTPAQTDTGSSDDGTKDGGTDTSSNGGGTAAPQVTRIQIKNETVVGGVKKIDVTKGDPVRIVVTSDAPDEIHLHGYDIEKEVAPGKPGNFQFKANLEGVFEMESHTAEDAGKEPLVAELTVNPS